MCRVGELHFKTAFKFKKLLISCYYSFVYKRDSLLAFQHYNIGSGIEIKYDDLFVSDKSRIKVKNSLEKLKKELSTQLISEDVDSMPINCYNSVIYKCSFPNCIFIAENIQSLDEHYASHEMNEKMNQHSKIKIEYSIRCKDIRARSIKFNSHYKQENNKQQIAKLKKNEPGFALKTIERKRFNDNQKTFLKAMFDQGEVKGGQKVTAEFVEKEMIKLHDRFTEEERLSRQQIFSYFTNLSKKNKDKKILEDLEGEEEEETD